MSRKSAKEDLPQHPIKVVAQRTGLTPEVLRIWEKRYSVVSPGRSSGGQRLYSDRDIERLRLLRSLTLGGRRIGAISKLSLPALKKILSEDQQAVPPSAPGVRPADSQAAREFLEVAHTAVDQLDQDMLRTILARAQASFGATELVEGVIGPLAQELGERWAEGEIEVFQEHFATVEIQKLLQSVMESGTTSDQAPGILVTTPAGEEHELGAMLVGAVAAAEGWRVIYLGPNLPAADITEAAKTKKVLAVALSAVYSTNPAGLLREFKVIRKGLPKKTRLLIGGAAANLSARSLNDLDALTVSSLHDLPAALAEIASGI